MIAPDESTTGKGGAGGAVADRPAIGRGSGCARHDCGWRVRRARVSALSDGSGSRELEADVGGEDHEPRDEVRPFARERRRAL